MAVDTRNKRASALQFQSVASVLPNPDGTIAVQYDAWHVAKLYAAELAAAPTAGYICVRSATIKTPNANGTIKIPTANGTLRC